MIEELARKLVKILGDDYTVKEFDIANDSLINDLAAALKELTDNGRIMEAHDILRNIIGINRVIANGLDQHLIFDSELQKLSAALRSRYGKTVLVSDKKDVPNIYLKIVSPKVLTLHSFEANPSDFLPPGTERIIFGEPVDHVVIKRIYGMLKASKLPNLVSVECSDDDTSVYNSEEWLKMERLLNMAQ